MKVPLGHPQVQDLERDRFRFELGREQRTQPVTQLELALVEVRWMEREENRAEAILDIVALRVPKKSEEHWSLPGREWLDALTVSQCHLRCATIKHYIMALAFLLFVFLVVILLIVGFVFPPTKWVEWFYKGGKKD